MMDTLRRLTDTYIPSRGRDYLATGLVVVTLFAVILVINHYQIKSGLADLTGEMNGKFDSLNKSRDTNAMIMISNITQRSARSGSISADQTELLRHQLDTTGWREVLVAIGGYSTQSYMGSVEYYSPSTDRWTSLPALPPRRREDSAAVQWGGYIYVMGGDSPGPVLDQVDRYNPVSKLWESRAPMTTPRNDHCAVTLGNYIYAIGGSSHKYTERYSPVLDQWTVRGSLHAVRSQFGCVALDRDSEPEIWAFGGTNDPAQEHAERYSPTLDTWTQVAVSHLERSHFGFVSLPSTNGVNLYALGGGGDGKSSTVDQLAGDPDVTAWRPVSGMTMPGEPRVYFGAAYLQSTDTIYAVGGKDTNAGTMDMMTMSPVGGGTSWTRSSARLVNGRQEFRLISALLPV